MKGWITVAFGGPVKTLNLGDAAGGDVVYWMT